MTGRVHLEVAGHTACVTLSHPGKLNAMSRQTWTELRSIFEELQSSSACRAVIVKGEADNFCAGGDIGEYSGFRFDQEQLEHFHEREVWGGLKAMLECDVPVVAAIEGSCLGGGLEIASCCDIRISARSARFGIPIAKLGFPMAPRESAIVVAAIGEATARELLLEATSLDAAEMKARGFLQRLVDDGQALFAAHAAADRIAALSPQAARLNKQYIRAVKASAATVSVSDAFSYASSHEHREGIAAFVEKRKPRF